MGTAPERQRDAYLSSVGLPVSVCLIAIFAIVLFGRAFLERSQSAFWGDGMLVAEVPVSVLHPTPGSDYPNLPLTGDDFGPRTGAMDAPFLPGTTVRLHGWQLTLGQPDSDGLRWPLTVIRIGASAGDADEIVASWVGAGSRTSFPIEELTGKVAPTEVARATVYADSPDGVLRLEIGPAAPVYFATR